MNIAYKKSIFFVILLLAVVGAVWVLVFQGDSGLQINHLTSNNKYISVPVWSREAETKFYIFNLDGTLKYEVESSEPKIAGVKLSKIHDNILYVTSHNREKDISKYVSVLWKCDLNSGSCEKLVSDYAAIMSPVELNDEDLLVVRSVPSYRGDIFAKGQKFVKFDNRDFYILSKDGSLKKVSDFGVSALGHVSVIGDSLIISADGSTKLGYPAGNRLGYNENGYSTIFKVMLNKANGKMSIEGDLKVPFVKVGRKRDTNPTAIGDPSLLAFFSWYTGENDARHKIVVFDYKKEKVIFEILPKLKEISNPSFSLSGELFYAEIDVSKLVLHSFDTKTGEDSIVSSVGWGELNDNSNKLVLE